jgi:predicted 3-demethylubiquinone-9 3-methyltransferase (glyoxalase superfamily)
VNDDSRNQASYSEEKMQKIAPCLWFNNQVEEAVLLYTSIFKDSKILSTVITMEFELFGQQFMALNGGPAYQFTPAISLFVKCESQAEVDLYWNQLAEGGVIEQCGWLRDKFGVSWQIIPNILGELLGGKDRVKAGRVMNAMLQMTKIETDQLLKAYHQEV